MKAILKDIPPEFLDSLDEDDREAIRETIGKEVEIVSQDRNEVEVEFAYDGAGHTIWVDRSFVEWL